MINFRPIYLLLIFSFLFLTGRSQDKKVAVTTFFMNKKVQPGDLGLGAEAIKQADALADDPAFNLEPMLGKLHDSFFNDLSKDLPFQLLDEYNQHFQGPSEPWKRVNHIYPDYG